MKKALALALFFMLAAGNFAYASSAGVCPPMMSSASQSTQISQEPHSCCDPSACDCKIGSASKLYPQAVDLTTAKVPVSGTIARAGFENISFSDNFSRPAFSSKSPPGHTALYVLHCAYLI